MRHMCLPSLSLSALLTLCIPVQAQFTVFDPSNFSQNVMTAARSLEQINNQISSLQNEAQMLTNEARNLTSLPYSSLQQLQSSVQNTQQLLGQAQNIAYNVQSINTAFQTSYAPASASQSDQALIANAQQRWQNAVSGFQDAMRIQAGVVGNIGVNQSQVSTLVGSSQSAIGALQAAQAGNQILALQSQQLSDLTATIAAQGRAQSLQAAQQLAAQSQAKEQLRRFLLPGSGYQSAKIRMFQ